MARKVFYSFHYKEDNWRVSQVRGIGMVEGNQAARDHDWETIERGGDPAIEAWINAQMAGRTCLIVLAGTNTSDRKWINYEIKRAWNNGMGVMGIQIHNLLDRHGEASNAGGNPFDHVSPSWFSWNPLSSLVQLHRPPFTQSQKVYGHIANNLDRWIEDAIAIRRRHD